jgi:hypothetical protein
MAAPFRLIKIGCRAIKRILTGEILHRIDLEIAGGLGVLSLLLKRGKSSGSKYVVLQSYGYYYLFELEEFDRFIEAADEIRAAQTSSITVSPHTKPALGHRADMALGGEVLRRVDTDIYEGHVKMSLRLKREKNTAHEYIVLATITFGWYLCYPFELDEFHRFIGKAKEIRAAARNFNPAVHPSSPGLRPGASG